MQDAGCVAVAPRPGVAAGRVASPGVFTPPPDHVLAAFGVAGSRADVLPGGRDRAFRCADAVIKKVEAPAETAWVASVFEHLQVPGVRLARPLRASDGRWVVAGWGAQRFVSGEPESRYAEIIEVAVVLHAALAEVPEPRFLDQRSDLYSRADRLAWSGADRDGLLGNGHGAQRFAELAAGSREVTAPRQLVHRDLFGNVLFDDGSPAVVDVTPTWRPAGFGAAVVAVDAVAWGGAATDLLEQFGELPQWGQLLRRALMFRLAVSLLHPRTTPSSLVDMLAAVEVIRPHLDAGPDQP